MQNDEFYRSLQTTGSTTRNAQQHQCKWETNTFHGNGKVAAGCSPKGADQITTNSLGDLCDSRNWNIEFHARHYHSDTDTTTFSYLVTNDKEVPKEDVLEGEKKSIQPNKDISHVTLGWKGSCCVLDSSYWGPAEQIGEGGKDGVDPTTCVAGLKVCLFRVIILYSIIEAKP